MAKVTSGGLCIDLSVGVGQLSEVWQITGGTGRFKKASGSLTLTSTVLPVLFTDANNAVLLANFGELRGTLTGIGEDD